MYISVCTKEASFGFLFFSILILRANVYVRIHIDLLLGKVLAGHLFLKVKLEVFHIFRFFPFFYSSIAPVFMDPLELYKMQFAVCDCFTFEP